MTLAMMLMVTMMRKTMPTVKFLISREEASSAATSMARPGQLTVTLPCLPFPDQPPQDGRKTPNQLLIYFLIQYFGIKLTLHKNKLYTFSNSRSYFLQTKLQTTNIDKNYLQVL